MTCPIDDADVSDQDFLSFPEAALAVTRGRLPSADLESMRAVLLLHRVTSAIVYDLESSVHRPAGWSWSSFRLLFTLWISGNLESKRAAALSGMSRAAVSSLTKTLEKAGLLARRTDPLDGRSVILKLTPTGARRFEEVFREHNSRETSWMGELPDEDRAAIIRILLELNHTARSPWVKRR
ncbi:MULTISPECIES: MarR family winged helix-turn-helix transcriptional regulator [unclassified Arthrobacter]|uniref:MarR family winged helix-turn-helix transcriptional regulator n=1 Tax=unclassified Arthrobacter TaxID=235627 RepID=UPI003671F115